MRIVVDVMGGDHGCGVVIDGVHQALGENAKLELVYLVGDEGQIRQHLKADSSLVSRIQVVHASEVLTMEDKPVTGLRKKKDSSIARAVELLKDGKAEAMISPGNTGGVVACSHIRLRCIPGVERPAIATVMPAPENEFILIDAGANVECRPIHLAQQAIMGHVYSRDVLGYAKPRVGILSVGTEDVKGNELTLEAFKLCKKLDINFIGNVEGHDLFANRVDVVVCDGFTGNVVLKTCESLAKALFKWLKGELVKTPVRKFGAYLAKDAFLAIKERTDADAYGGAPLLGLNANVTIAHGSAREKAIKNAIRYTCNAVQHHINTNIAAEIEKANERLQQDPSPTKAESPTE